MLTSILTRLRTFVADCLPIVARSPYGWAVGWVERYPGGRVGHLEQFIVRRRGGTVVGLLRVRDAWLEACDRRGVVLTTTRVNRKRHGVLGLMRRDGWKQYAEDRRCIWFRRTLPERQSA